jgi:NADPH-dependent 2,4-dienoyl-CoA reductase/sulfur reductase-like enzyme
MKKEFFLRLVLFIGICFLVYQFGIKPMLNNNYSPPRPDGSWTKDKLSNEKDKYDVVIVGGEPEGIAAAVSAARLGAKTLLLCDSNELGGTVVRSFDFDPESSRGGRGEFLNKGIFYEIYANLHVDKYGTFTIERFKE